MEKKEITLEDFLRFQARVGASALNLVKLRDKTTVNAQFSRQFIMQWLKSPIANERNLREASRAAYRSSQQYRELIQYKSSLPLWKYVLRPMAADYTTSEKIKKIMRRELYNYGAYVEKMNLPHELEKILRTAFIDGVCYGVIWEAKESFYIQPLNPDFCRLATIEDGTFLYEFDMARLQETDLVSYPPIISTLWHKWHDDKTHMVSNWQLIPGDVSVCLKADESLLTYALPPYVSTLPLVADLENYTELSAAEAELSLYKMIAMTIPLNSDKKPTIGYNEVEKYYNQVASNLPDEVGAIATPFQYTVIGFDESSTTTHVDRISDATNRFWAGSCVNSLIFGDATNKSATALKLAVQKDEQMIYACIKQASRIINRLLKYRFSSVKVRYAFEFLPVTWMNQEEKAKMYREAATYGIPTKMAYAATVGVPPENFEGMNVLEEDVLDMFNRLRPLHSSNTLSADAGRPSTEETGDTPSDQTDANRESGGD